MKNKEEFNLEKTNHKQAYSPEEMNNKYRFQERWQKNNGYVVKSFRFNSETINKLEDFAKDKGKSQISVLKKAYEMYKKTQSDKEKLSYWLDYVVFASDKQFDTIKGFKVDKDFIAEIEETCEQNNFALGKFASKIIEDYIDSNKDGE